MTGKWGGEYLLVVLLNLECAHPRKEKNLIRPLTRLLFAQLAWLSS